MTLLESLEGPEDIASLNLQQLQQLALELRQEIIRVCSLSGGHLASSLGAVELTVALHHLYDTRKDRIVWDVGHQTYGHKILTGRREQMITIRQAGGLAGFTTSSESEHDALTVGHASTSLAAALGMALARDARGEAYSVLAVIGDGSLTGGMALAALNQIGHLKPKMTIVLNDNEMSISENVGALNAFMRTLQVQPGLHRVEARGKKTLQRISEPLADMASRSKKAARRFFDPASANPFYAMGVRYVGPIDGHNLEQLRYYLAHLEELEGPTMLHIVTKKGKGYKIAESDPINWHGAGKFDVNNPEIAEKNYSWSDAFGAVISELAAQDDRLWAVTPAMREGSGLVGFSQQHPARYLDVGIAEDVAITTAAGLALRGEKPVVAIYSTFLQRGFDQVIHDVCLENLDVIFAVDRAGLVGGDGATHQGVYDISYLRALPNMSLAMPKDELELRSMFKAALKQGGPKAIRYPRGKVVAYDRDTGDGWADITWGSWDVLKEGGRVIILTMGALLPYALSVAEGKLDVGVVNARFIKPLDEGLLRALAESAEVFITIEDHVLAGGFGSAVAEFIVDNALPVRLKRLGIPDLHVPHGTPSHQYETYGYGPEALLKVVDELLQARPQVALVGEKVSASD